MMLDHQAVVNDRDLCARLVRVLEAIEDGDTEFAAETLFALLRELEEQR
jgi:hypothetical protein